MFFLALDCSTARGTLALGDLARRVQWKAEIPAGRGHGGELFTALAAAMSEIRARDGKLGGVIVGLGPGSYSGVRQSIAVAVGLAQASGAFVVGLPSPAALAPTPQEYQAVGNARRGAFYYAAVRAGCCVSGPELIADVAALNTRLSERPAWPIFTVESALPDAVLPIARVVWPDAGQMLGICAEYHLKPPLEPIYLRPVSVTLPKPAKAAVP